MQDEVGDWTEYTRERALPAMQGFLRTGAKEFIHYMFHTHKTPQGVAFWQDLGTAQPGELERRVRAIVFVNRVYHTILADMDDK